MEIAESSMWEGALKTLKSLINELSNTHSRIESDNKMDKSKYIGYIVIIIIIIQI